MELSLKLGVAFFELGKATLGGGVLGLSARLGGGKASGARRSELGMPGAQLRSVDTFLAEQCLQGPALPAGKAFVGLADDPQLVGSRKLTTLGDAALYSSAALRELLVVLCVLIGGVSLR